MKSQYRPVEHQKLHHRHQFVPEPVMPQCTLDIVAAQGNQVVVDVVVRSLYKRILEFVFEPPGRALGWLPHKFINPLIEVARSIDLMVYQRDTVQDRREICKEKQKGQKVHFHAAQKDSPYVVQQRAAARPGPFVARHGTASDHLIGRPPLRSHTDDQAHCDIAIGKYDGM